MLESQAAIQQRFFPLLNTNNHNNDTQLMVDLLYTTNCKQQQSETLGDFVDHICWET